jgi:HNH endonuclease
MKHSVPPAALTIEAMKGLLGLRRRGAIKRLVFLKAWGKLRRLLTLSKEYQIWRHEVRERAGGACEQCGEIGQHAHHKEQVSRNPDRALDPRNGEYLCRRCHDGEHEGKVLQPRRSGGRATHRSPTGHRTPRPAPAGRSPNSAPRERASRAISRSA